MTGDAGVGTPVGAQGWQRQDADLMGSPRSADALLYLCEGPAVEWAQPQGPLSHPACGRPPGPHHSLTLGQQDSPGHPPPAWARTGDAHDPLVGLEGEQRLGQLPQEGLQDHGRDVDVPVVVEVHGLPCAQTQTRLRPGLGTSPPLPETGCSLFPASPNPPPLPRCLGLGGRATDSLVGRSCP